MADLLPAMDENYADYIIKYSEYVYGSLNHLEGRNFQIINENYAVFYSPLQESEPLILDENNYGAVPKYYVQMDLESLNNSGIARLHNHPYLMLRGRGTAVAVIDSGIDYENTLFRNSDGSTRIAFLWDQTIHAEESATVPYGQEFTRERINEALESENPKEIVPSVDTNGHGTFLAGIAAGGRNVVEDFSGTAPEATLIVVKLKQIKKYLRDFYILPEEKEIYQENDIMFAIQYAIRCAGILNMPLSICIGLGTSLGSHTGESPLSQYLNNVNRYARNVTSVAAGNEGNSRHHYQGVVEEREGYEDVELKIGTGERGFSMEFWGDSPNRFSVTIQTPSGERAEVVSSRNQPFQTFEFVFIDTKIEVSYIPIERQTGKTLMFFRIFAPVEGIWKFQVFSDGTGESRFYMWLPVNGLVGEETYFLESAPDTTITTPGAADAALTMTAFDYRDESLFVDASRGFTPQNSVKPDLAAPGVQLDGPMPGGRMTVRSGTSVAAAYTCGAAALLLEWAIVKGNAPYFTGASVKNYLIRGARRSKLEEYPNPEWGYGILDLYRVFELLE